MVSIKGNQIEVRPSIGGPTEMKHMKHVKYVLPADQYIKHIPDYSTFGRKATLRMNPKQIPDLLVISRYLSYYKYWTVNSSYEHPKCGCKYIKFCWKKNI